MFQATVDIGKVNPEGLFSRYTSLDHRYKIQQALVEQGIPKSKRVLLRGGFMNQKGLELLISKGSDYHGLDRIGFGLPFSYYGLDRIGLPFRKDPNGIFCSPVDHIGGESLFVDPLRIALHGNNGVNALAVYDGSELELLRPYERKEYRFLHPRKKLQALLGILYIQFQASI